MSNGSIKTPVPNLVTPEQMIANNIANTIVPATSYNIFDEIAAASPNPDVRQTMPASTGYASTMSEPQGTTSLKALQNQLVSETRPELAVRTGLALPNLAKGPERGIATSAKKRAMSPQEYANQVEGGVGDAARAGDTRFVDDKGWPVTLKQILGSRLLSPEMLKKADIRNVQKLIKVSGGTAQQNQEMQYMFQRMMLEGFIRGVDITKELEKQGGLHITVGNYETIGVHKSSGYGTSKIIFQRKWWDSKSDADKYTLFLHEVGHSLLNASHENNRSQKKKDPNRIMTPIYAGSVLRNYDKLMDQFFSESTGINRFKVTDFGKPAAYDAAGYPALSGIDTGYQPGQGTPPANPGEGGADVANVNTNTNVTNNAYTIVPQTIELAEQGGTMGQIQKATQTAAPTVTAPGASLSSDIQTATKTFAAGMADLSKGTGPDMKAAGALLKSG